MSEQGRATFDLLSPRVIAIMVGGTAALLYISSILPDPNGLPKDPAQWDPKYTKPGAALKYNLDLNPSPLEPTESPTVSPTASPAPAYLDIKIQQQPTRMSSRTPTRIPPTVPQNPASQRKR
jgi:hypothetical protein